MTLIHLPWWNKRSTFEKQLLAMGGTLFVVVISLSCLLVFGNQETDEVSLNLMIHKWSFIFNFQSFARTTRDVNADVDFTRDPRLTKIGKFNKRKKENYCVSKECITAAADLLENIDESVDPCDDFYSFACGGFIENKVIPDDKSKFSAFTVLSDKLNEQVKFFTKRSKRRLHIYF